MFLYFLYHPDSGPVSQKLIYLTDYEVRTLNYAYALNGSKLRYVSFV